MKTYFLFLLAGFFFYPSLKAKDKAPLFFAIDTGYYLADSVSDSEWMDIDGYVKYDKKDNTIRFKFERLDDRHFVIEDTFIAPDDDAGHNFFLWGTEKLDGSGSYLIYFGEVEDLDVYEWRIIYDLNKGKWVGFFTRMIED